MKRVLLVDDDDDLREVFGDVLAYGGYDVAVAADGPEALAWMRIHGPPDLVVLDLMMPGMAGAEVKARMDEDPVLASVPVVVLSGDMRLHEQAAAMGAADFITKPVEFNTLLSTIARHAA